MKKQMHLVVCAHTLPGVSLFKQPPEAAPHEPGGGFSASYQDSSGLHVQRGLKKKTALAKKTKKCLNYLRATLLDVPALRLQLSLTSHTEEQNKLRQLCTAVTDFSQLAVKQKNFSSLLLSRRWKKAVTRRKRLALCHLESD